MPVIMLVSCSQGGKASWPSLDADDLWDHMAEERGKPMPSVKKNNMVGESVEIWADLPTKPPKFPLTDQDRATRHRILTGASKQYDAISATLDTDFQDLTQARTSGEDWQPQWRTIQLLLSRLSNLKKNMDQAIDALGRRENIPPEDQILLNNSRLLLKAIVERIVQTRNRLNDFTQP